MSRSAASPAFDIDKLVVAEDAAGTPAEAVAASAVVESAPVAEHKAA
jgi:hypothetical protein